jgi:hypothetical protein
VRSTITVGGGRSRGSFGGTKRMTRSAKIWTSALLTATVSVGLLWTSRWLFLAPCSSGYPYALLVILYPFASFLATFEAGAAGWFFLLALVQYPAYGFIYARGWLKAGPIAPMVFIAGIHGLSCTTAGILMALMS